MNITLKQKHWLGVVIIALFSSQSTFADDLLGDSRAALQQLVAQNPAAAKCSTNAI